MLQYILYLQGDKLSGQMAFVVIENHIIIAIIIIIIIIIIISTCIIFIIIVITSYMISLYQANLKAEIKIKSSFKWDQTYVVKLFIQFQTATPLSMNPLENAGNLDFFGQRPWRQGFQGLFSCNWSTVKFYCVSLSFLHLIV